MVTTTSPTPASVAAASRAHAPERMSGAHAIVRTLEDLGTDLVFGIPGGAVLPLYDALHTSTKLRHVLTRHEQGAGHAAEGYAQASGKVGVCIATSGPGATNLVTALADANLDSVPIVAITGQVGSNLFGNRCLPRGRYSRRDDADYQAQLHRDGTEPDSSCHCSRIPSGVYGPSGAGLGGYPEGRAKR